MEMIAIIIAELMRWWIEDVWPAILDILEKSLNGYQNKK